MLGVFATVVLVSSTVVVAIRIGQRPATAPAAVALDGAPAVQQGIVNGPDISMMSPDERATRLYDRVIRVSGEGKADSVDFFAPMALAAFAAIPRPDVEARYRMARVALIAGAMPVARAQTDTILRGDSTHLLGLILRSDIARANGDSAEAKQADATIARVARTEHRRPLAEYHVHRDLIDRVLRRLGVY